MESFRKKSFQVLKQRKRLTYKTPIFKRTPGRKRHYYSFSHGWEVMPRDGKMLPYLRKSGSTIIAIDAPAHGLSGGTEFNIPQYAAFIDILVQKFKPQFLIGHSR
jgi:pimeloyl-ACP methyl ester carboxylesterase